MQNTIKIFIISYVFVIFHNKEAQGGEESQGEKHGEKEYGEENLFLRKNREEEREQKGKEKRKRQENIKNFLICFIF